MNEMIMDPAVWKYVDKPSSREEIISAYYAGQAALALFTHDRFIMLRMLSEGSAAYNYDIGKVSSTYTTQVCHVRTRTAWWLQIENRIKLNNNNEIFGAAQSITLINSAVNKGKSFRSYILALKYLEAFPTIRPPDNDVYFALESTDSYLSHKYGDLDISQYSPEWVNTAVQYGWVVPVGAKYEVTPTGMLVERVNNVFKSHPEVCFTLEEIQARIQGSYTIDDITRVIPGMLIPRYEGKYHPSMIKIPAHALSVIDI